MTHPENKQNEIPISDVAAVYQKERFSGHMSVWRNTYTAAARQFEIADHLEPFSFEAVGNALEEITTQRTLARGTIRYRGAVLLGTPASGKTTMRKQLQDNGFRSLITYVSREPREGEEDGVDYHFVTNEQMLQRAEEGELFLLSALPGGQKRIAVNKKTIADYLQEDIPFVTNQRLHDWESLEQDMSALNDVHDEMKDVLPVFLLPPSPTVLFERSLSRASSGLKNPPETRPDQPVPDEIVLNELERSFSGVTELEASLENNRVLYIVNNDVQRVTQKILTLHGKSLEI